VHAREQAQDYARFAEQYGVQWTPTILMLDPKGKERRRIEGFLPADEFRAQLELGLGQVSFAGGDYRDAHRRSSEVVAQLGETDAAAEAMYWAGVAKYKETNDPGALGATAKAFEERYQDSAWAKKASVWKK
jgi:hypothetical protein